MTVRTTADKADDLRQWCGVNGLVSPGGAHLALSHRPSGTSHFDPKIEGEEATLHWLSCNLRSCLRPPVLGKHRVAGPKLDTEDMGTHVGGPTPSP